eukprot:6251629-Amphidinium_carterae.1
MQTTSRERSQGAASNLNGALPEGGIRWMSAVTQFAIRTNHFEGTLPGSGLRAMRAVSRFLIYVNDFEGTLPEGGITPMST